MPFTPYHLVAGTSVKSVFPKYFSWSTFALTNILIDCEALYYLFTTGSPSHKFFHTILGVSIIAIICATLGKPVCEFGLKIWNKNLKMENINWLKTNTKISKISSWSGALIGAYSQLIFDSIMHRDMTPFSPLTNQNDFLRIISVENLHYICLGLFIIGIFVYIFRNLFLNK